MAGTIALGREPLLARGEIGVGLHCAAGVVTFRAGYATKGENRGMRWRPEPAVIDFEALRDFVWASRIVDSELHGLAHWRQVESNGLLLAPVTGADATVVRLFALFHDCKRKDDGCDAGHGPRGAGFAKECFEEGRIGITPEQFAQLHHACAFHTAELRSGDATIDTCYDADRLDLGRVGIALDPERMATIPGARIARKSRRAKVPAAEMREWLKTIRPC